MNKVHQLVTFDRLRLFSQYWEPEKTPRGTICIVHGLGEHSSRYVHFAEAMNQSGFVLAAFDLRGHGKSEGQRGHTPSFGAYMEDISVFLAEVSKRFPGFPVFLYGYSLGGVLALNYPLRKHIDLAGVVAAGAALRTSIEEQRIKAAVARTCGALLPTVSLRNGIDPNLMCRDPEVVEKFQSDPLTHDKITLGLGRIMLEAISWIFNHADEFPHPLLLMHGTADQLAYVRGSQEFAARVPKNCTLKLWEGLSHELHSEPEKSHVFSYLTDWFDMQVEGSMMFRSNEGIHSVPEALAGISSSDALHPDSFHE